MCIYHFVHVDFCFRMKKYTFTAINGIFFLFSFCRHMLLSVNLTFVLSIFNLTLYPSDETVNIEPVNCQFKMLNQPLFLFF